jgi:hypothetical protein
MKIIFFTKFYPLFFYHESRNWEGININWEGINNTRENYKPYKFPLEI